ncbi:flavodoxin family protein, partial [Asanoa sp. NPDC050611]
MSLFRLDASIRVEGSHSREIADIVEREWRLAHPDDPIVQRHVGTAPLPSTAWSDATTAKFLTADKWSPA